MRFNMIILPVYIFTNGALYYHGREKYDAMGVTPVFAHFNFLVGDKRKKLAMKSRGVWRLKVSQ